MTKLLRGYNADNQLIFEIGEGADVAESFPVSEEDVCPGMVVSIDQTNPGSLTKSSTAYDRLVAGVVSGANGLNCAIRIGEERIGNHPVALAGRVYCMVDSSNGPIQPGDLLTTSSVPGHAMRADDHTKAQGAILGKAMEPLEAGERGFILVLVTLQ